MKTLKLVLKVLASLVGLALLWWIVRSQDDPIGEMIVEQDDIDSDESESFDSDDPGVDVDDE